MPSNTQKMFRWAGRLQRQVSNAVNHCSGSSSIPHHHYPGCRGCFYHMPKLKFGISLTEVCKDGRIPSTLLYIILKLNKEAPKRRGVFRAPGNQNAIKKLSHILQAGYWDNFDNYSLYTIASVLKKFLLNLSHGIFGELGEEQLLAIMEISDPEVQVTCFRTLFTSLPICTQHLLVLLMGTFRAMANNFGATGMNSVALAISVTPSFFHSCFSQQRRIHSADIVKLRSATDLVKHLIDNFNDQNLFGRQNYEYYARLTGRIIKVENDWICCFEHTAATMMDKRFACSTPAIITSPGNADMETATFSQDQGRLSISLESPRSFCNDCADTSFDAVDV